MRAEEEQESRGQLSSLYIFYLSSFGLDAALVKQVPPVSIE